MTDTLCLHAGLLAFCGQAGYRGVLLQGPSGSGKSDLALRLLSRGFRLVADDRVLVWRSGERVFGRAPDAIAGLIEVRGLGVLRAPALDHAPLDLLVECLADPEYPERMPTAAPVLLLGVEVGSLRLKALEPCAPDKVLAGLRLKFL